MLHPAYAFFGFFAESLVYCAKSKRRKTYLHIANATSCVPQHHADPAPHERPYTIHQLCVARLS